MDVEGDKRLVMDVDGVLVRKEEDTPYSKREPNEDVLSQLRRYDSNGFYIILYTARNMRTYEGRIGKINANTAEVLLEWLDRHDVPYDEIHYGKPWCGNDGYYVDDKAVRPSEFLSNSHEELREIVDNTNES